mgnify:CR=1 FL=1
MLMRTSTFLIFGNLHDLQNFDNRVRVEGTKHLSVNLNEKFKMQSRIV